MVIHNPGSILATLITYLWPTCLLGLAEPLLAPSIVEALSMPSARGLGLLRLLVPSALGLVALKIAGAAYAKCSWLEPVAAPGSGLALVTECASRFWLSTVRWAQVLLASQHACLEMNSLSTNCIAWGVTPNYMRTIITLLKGVRFLPK